MITPISIAGFNDHLEYQTLYNDVTKMIYEAMSYDLVVNNNCPVLMESYAKASALHLKKIGMTTIENLITNLLNFVKAVIQRMKKMYHEANIKYLFDYKDILLRADKTELVVEMPERIYRSDNSIDIAGGYDETDRIVQAAIKAYNSAGGQLGTHLSFKKNSGMRIKDMFGMTPAGARAKIASKCLKTQLRYEDIPTIRDTELLVQNHILGNNRRFSGRALDINKLYDNLKDLPKEIETLEKVILPRAHKLESLYDKTMDSLPAHEDMISINGYVTAAITEYVSIVRYILTSLLIKYNVTVKSLVELLKQIHGQKGGTENA